MAQPFFLPNRATIEAAPVCAVSQAGIPTTNPAVIPTLQFPKRNLYNCRARRLYLPIPVKAILQPPASICRNLHGSEQRKSLVQI